MTTNDERVCTNCVFHIRDLTGYSEYTITGAVIGCMFHRNDFDDETEGERNTFAETCDLFRQGDGCHVGYNGDEVIEGAQAWIEAHMKQP